MSNNESTATSNLTNPKSSTKKSSGKFETEKGLKSGKIYDSVSDFSRARGEDDILKILVIGEPGVGKSSFLNKLRGIRFKQKALDDSDDEFGELKLVPRKKTLSHFKVGYGKSSVTKKTSFILTHLFDDPDSPKLMLIDTPGIFDPEEHLLAKQGLGQHANRKDICTDMVEKLRALGSINGIMLIMSKSQGGRLQLSTVQTVRGFEYMFADTRQNFFLSFAFVYGKCDEDQRPNWIKLKKKKAKEYKKLMKTIEKCGVLVGMTNDLHLDSRKDAERILKCKGEEGHEETGFEYHQSCQLFFVSSKECTLDAISHEDEIFKMLKLFFESGELETKSIRNPRKYLKGSEPSEANRSEYRRS